MSFCHSFWLVQACWRVWFQIGLPPCSGSLKEEAQATSHRSQIQPSQIGHRTPFHNLIWPLSFQRSPLPGIRGKLVQALCQSHLNKRGCPYFRHVFWPRRLISWWCLPHRLTRGPERLETKRLSTKLYTLPWSGCAPSREVPFDRKSAHCEQIRSTQSFIWLTEFTGIPDWAEKLALKQGRTDFRRFCNPKL